MTSPWTSQGTVSSLAESTEPAAQRALVDSPLNMAVPKHPYQHDTFAHLTKNIEAITPALAIPFPLTDTIPGSQLAALSTTWRGSDQAWGTGLGPWATWVEGIRHGIQVSQSSTVNVVAYETAIPVTVTNSLTVPVKVSVLLKPSNNRLIPQASAPQSVQPDSRSVFQVPGRAVADGETSVIAEVVTPHNAKIASGKAFDVRIRRTWEGRAIMILGAALLLVVIFGITRGIRKKRRKEEHTPQETQNATSDS